MTQTEMYHTNDTVKETGKYLCTSGAVKELQEGDAFPHCPKTNELTTWRPADHEQKTEATYHTNDTVKETGKYLCTSGAMKELQEGDAFPHCPKTNELTTWRHADHEQKTGPAGRYIDEKDLDADLKSGLTFPTPDKTVDDLGDEVNVKSGRRFPTPQKS